MAGLRQAVRLHIDSTLGPDARRAEFARLAREGVAQLIAEKKAPASYVRYVDGRQGAPEESVKPAGGVILYEFAAVAEAVAFALGFLRARSPTHRRGGKSRSAPGRYRDSFFLGVGGRFIPAADFKPDRLPPDAEVIISNSQPYSRKVDVQLVGAKKLSFNVPAGLFDDAARAIRQRFGNTVKARRVYNVKWTGQYVLRKRKVHGRRIGQTVESPALILSPVG